MLLGQLCDKHFEFARGHSIDYWQGLARKIQLSERETRGDTNSKIMDEDKQDKISRYLAGIKSLGACDISLLGSCKIILDNVFIPTCLDRINPLCDKCTYFI